MADKGKGKAKAKEPSAKDEKEAERARGRLFKQAPSLLLLVGLPGAGKSTFSQQLSTSTRGKYILVSQDEVRSRSICEERFSAAISDRSGCKVILDRCNPDAQDRKKWLDLAMRPKDAVAIYFDVPASVCKDRVKARQDHPTIPFGSGETIVDGVAKGITIPTKAEGFYSVRIVKTKEDSDKLIREFGGETAPLRQAAAPAPAPEEGDAEGSAAVEPEDLPVEDLSVQQPAPAAIESPAPQAPVESPAAAAAAAAAATSTSTPKPVPQASVTRVPTSRPPVAKPAAKGKPTAKGKGKATAEQALDVDGEDDGDEPVEKGLVKFPRTRHIVDTGGATRDDLLFSPDEARQFYGKKGQVISVEEKVDGANIGISISSERGIMVQNRSHFVNSSTHKQFGQLDAWIEQHRAALYEILEPDRHILFGEWLYAKHSVYYTRLPGYFVAFDIYDKQEAKFFAREERNRRLEGSGIPTVPLIHHGPVASKEDLLAFLERGSVFGDGTVEGIYCRIDDGIHLKIRGKIVRADFLQQIEAPWSHQGIVKNQIDYSFA